jgi:hypothetical protein
MKIEMKKGGVKQSVWVISQIQERSQIREPFPNSGTFNASKFRNVPEFGNAYLLIDVSRILKTDWILFSIFMSYACDLKITPQTGGRTTAVIYC